MNTAPEIRSVAVGETRNVSISFAGLLDDGELLTGTPTVTVSPGGPTLSSARVNPDALHINGKLNVAGQAVLFQVTGVQAAITYTLAATVGTNMSPPQTLIGYATLLGETE